MTARPTPSGVPRLHRVKSIAWREFKHTVFTKGFLIGAISFPLLMFAAIGLMPLLISDKPVPVTGTIVVADSDGTAAEAMQRQFTEMREPREITLPNKSQGDPFGDFDPEANDPLLNRVIVNVTVQRVPVQEDHTQERDRVSAGTILAFVKVPAALLERRPADDLDIEIFVPTASPAKTTSLISRVAREATVIARLERHGESREEARALVRPPSTETARVTESGVAAPENAQLRFLIPGGFMFLMWIAAFTSANQLLTTTIEEKSSKVIEVLLSAVSPLELLAGKILGQSLVSLVMLSTYGAAGLSGLAFAAMLDLIPISTIFLFIIWFALGYLMVAAIMTAVGSAVSDLREAQSLIQPAMLLMMVPLILWLPIAENPTGTLATVMSFVPPCGPFVMVLRTTGAVEPIAWWQVPAALAVNAAATIALIWMAARIFRVGVLMQGKPPSPRELLRWARMR